MLLVKALMLHHDYYASCIRNKAEPEHVLINGDWLNDFVDAYRISSRRPNRKFKVARPVLKQRLKIFWIVVAKIRTLIELHHGYDPKIRIIDQPPPSMATRLAVLSATRLHSQVHRLFLSSRIVRPRENGGASIRSPTRPKRGFAKSCQGAS